MVSIEEGQVRQGASQTVSHRRIRKVIWILPNDTLFGVSHPYISKETVRTSGGVIDFERYDGSVASVSSVCSNVFCSPINMRKHVFWSSVE